MQKAADKSHGTNLGIYKTNFRYQIHCSILDKYLQDNLELWMITNLDTIYIVESLTNILKTTWNYSLLQNEIIICKF